MADLVEDGYRQGIGKDLSFIQMLEALPSKPRRSRKQPTKRDIVALHYENLKAARDKGYTYEELADLLETSSLGVKIRPATLRKYMNQAAKGASANKIVPLQPSTKVVAKRVKNREELPAASSHTETPVRRETLYATGLEAHASEAEFENI